MNASTNALSVLTFPVANHEIHRPVLGGMETCERQTRSPLPAILSAAAAASPLEPLAVVNANFPHVGKRISALWGSAALVTYLNDLLDETRHEFSNEMALAFYKLRREHQLKFPFAHAPAAHALADDENFKMVVARHTHIGARLKERWGRPGFSPFVNDLLQDTRGDTREGFSPEVAMALIKLMQQHDSEFPEFVVEASDIWTQAIGA